MNGTCMGSIQNALLARAIEPYANLVNLHKVLLNSAFKFIQDLAYATKETVIESLEKLLDSNLEADVK